MKQISHLFPSKYVHPATTQLAFITEICKTQSDSVDESEPSLRKSSYALQIDRLSQRLHTSSASAVSRLKNILGWKHFEGGGCNRNSNPINSVPIPNNDDLYYCARPLFIVGKCFGLIPISGIFSNNLKAVTFKWKSFSTLLSLCLCLSIFVVAAVGISELFATFFGLENLRCNKHGRFMIVDTRGPICMVVGSLTYSILIFKSGRIVNLFTRWRSATSGLILTSTTNKNAFTSINLLTFALLVPGIIHLDFMQLTGFGIFKVNIFRDYENHHNISALEKLYTTYCPHWSEMVSYNPVIVLYFLMAAKLAFFAWLFTDALIIVMSRLLYFKFRTLFIQARLRMSSPKKRSIDLTVFRKTSVETLLRENLWLAARQDHLICLHLLWETEKILSPLIFLSYSLSIYYTCMLIHQGIAPSAHHNSFVQAAMATVTLVALVIRMTLVSIMASSIHEYAHSISKCIQKCPTSLYSSESKMEMGHFDSSLMLERLERLLSNTTIGLSGLGCFVVTKAFLLVVVSVIFTFEIVLLQTPSFPKINNNASNGLRFPSQM